MALNLYYVDPVGGNDGNVGSLAAPWLTTQHALDTALEGADGTQINIKSSGPDVLAASLNLVQYIVNNGALSATQPLILRGYTAAANDGGRGALNGNSGGFTIMAGVPAYVSFVDLRCHNVGAIAPLNLANHCTVFRCEVDTWSGAVYGINLQNGAEVIGCYIHNGGVAGTSGAILIYQGAVLDNYITGVAGNAVFTLAQNAVAIWRNVIYLTTTTSIGIHLYRCYDTSVQHNSIYQSVAGTASGIYGGVLEAFEPVIMNNIICGFNGVGGKAIWLDDKLAAVVGYNAFWQNTVDEQYDRPPKVDLGNDVALGADPFTSAATGDFSLTAVAQAALRDVGWPAAYLGAHANTDGHITIGPIQYGTGGGGAGPVSISPWRGGLIG
ncbi:MAG: hypothetical protein WC683_12650 [bacterium]